MRDDWQPGDLALCVRANLDPEDIADRLVVGRIYKVSAVLRGGSALDLEGLYAPQTAFYWPGYIASRFRKIRPHTPDAEDVETIRLLTGTPVREPVA